MSWADENGISVGVGGVRYEVQAIVANQTWTTKDGRNIKISEMTDSHLYNAYKKFDDERLAREILLRLFAKEIKQ